MTDPQTELHNRVVGDIVASIVKPPLQAGGTPSDVLVVLESVVTGVILALVKLGGDETVLDLLFEGVKDRLAKIRLRDRKPEGSA